jgi:hypothetical protein
VGWWKGVGVGIGIEKGHLAVTFVLDEWGVEGSGGGGLKESLYGIYCHF